MSATCPVCGNELQPEAPACPHCGFKLLGSTQKFTPVALDDAPSPQHAPQRAAHATLRVVRGPQTGIVLELGGSSLSIGRNPQCDVFLNDMTVSRAHAFIEPVAGGYRIRDDNSFNGVWVNNANVDARKLAHGDIIQIGAFCLLYEED